MIDLWRRGARGAAAASEKAGKSRGGLSDAVMVELANRAESLVFEAGSDLLQQQPELKRQMFLVRRGRLLLQGIASASIIVKSGEVVQGLTGQLSLDGCVLRAEEDVQLFALTESQFSQLHEQAQIALLQLGSAFAAEVVRCLLQEQATAVASLQQLAGSVGRELRTQNDGLEHSSSLAAIIERIPRLPVSSLELLQRLLDEDSTHAQVVELVRQDPTMTATLLKAVNSPAFSFDNHITDLSHAVTLLGFEGVYQIIMAETLRKSLPDTEGFKASYQRALALSYIAFALAQLTGRGRPAQLATIALLHDMGRVVLAVMHKQNPACRELIRRVPAGVPGGLLLRSWLLPDAIWRSISLQHYPQWVPPEQLPAAWRDSVSLLHLAGWVLDYLVKKESPSPFIDDYMRQLELEPMPAEQLWQHKVIPLLRQRRNALPVSLRKLLG